MRVKVNGPACFVDQCRLRLMHPARVGIPMPTNQGFLKGALISLKLTRHFP